MTLAPAQRAHLRRDVGLFAGAAVSPLTAEPDLPSTAEPPAGAVVISSTAPSQ
jgi:hypothetical protein